MEAGSPLTDRRVSDLDWGNGHGARKMMTEYRYSSNKNQRLKSRADGSWWSGKDQSEVWGSSALFGLSGCPERVFRAFSNRPVSLLSKAGFLGT